MDATLAHIRLKRRDLILFLRELVECESPSDNPASIARANDLIATWSGDIAKARRVRNHLVLEFKTPGKKRTDGQVMGLGHTDTVWPLGTLKTMPWREGEGRLWGPGVLDMKAGLTFFLFAARSLVERDIPTPRKIVLVINADEEVGSADSRALTEAEAKKSAAVLVLEPGTGLEGEAKTARKGIGDYSITVKGVAAHAGVDFEKGANAIVELARQVERVSALTDLRKGTTVSPGVIQGGTRRNVIPAEASVQLDLRVTSLAQAKRVERQLRALKAIDRRCKIEIAGGLNRPPMERSPGVVRLYKLARKLAAEMGVTLDESATGGGSDGNFTAALGVPTLDGIGAVGEGAHAKHESILIDRIDDRTALLAKLLAAV
ncbi:MAG: M20 family metallopeptidase [Bryobacteraceae bacterium]|nr:M20 family metallopeptidase [Bryobacteraceae bacterium]